ncbi:MAG: tetratricopeptide repeat protein [Chitinivibrionales bacterium]|nr:tetratricopeptide repeat protein [Chitinivibrionales bacterium]MBD3396384.1 tetratricopeptide repeat protein [Chitinivibrionales bacterium]
MEIKYSKRKQELRSDPVMEGIVNARDFVRENSNTLLSVVIVALLVVGGFAAYTHVKRSSQERAADAFGKAITAYAAGNNARAVEAFSLVADKYRSAPQAAYAAYILGHLYLGQGNFDEAATWFEVAVNHKNGGFVSGEALESLALCYEAKNDLARAFEYLQKALAEKSVKYRHPAIRWKLALLSRKMGRHEQMRQYCQAILSDTLASQYRQKAENLLAELKVL